MTLGDTDVDERQPSLYTALHVSPSSGVVQVLFALAVAFVCPKRDACVRLCDLTLVSEF